MINIYLMTYFYAPVSTIVSGAAKIILFHLRRDV